MVQTASDSWVLPHVGVSCGDGDHLLLAPFHSHRCPRKWRASRGGILEVICRVTISRTAELELDINTGLRRPFRPV